MGKHTLPYFVFPGIDFRRGQGLWPTKPKMTLHKHSIHPPQREATPFPAVPSTLTHPHFPSGWQTIKATEAYKAFLVWEPHALASKSEKALGCHERLFLPLRPCISEMIRLGLSLLYAVKDWYFQPPASLLLPWGQCCWDRRQCVPQCLVYMVWLGSILYLPPSQSL